MIPSADTVFELITFSKAERKRVLTPLVKAFSINIPDTVIINAGSTPAQGTSINQLNNKNMNVQKSESSAVANIVLFAERYGYKLSDYITDIEIVYTIEGQEGTFIKNFLATDANGEECFLQASYSYKGRDSIKYTFANVEVIRD